MTAVRTFAYHRNDVGFNVVDFSVQYGKATIWRITGYLAVKLKPDPTGYHTVCRWT